MTHSAQSIIEAIQRDDTLDQKQRVAALHLIGEVTTVIAAWSKKYAHVDEEARLRITVKMCGLVRQCAQGVLVEMARQESMAGDSDGPVH